MKKWKSIHQSDTENNSSKSSIKNQQRSKNKCPYTPLKFTKNSDTSVSQVVEKATRIDKISMDSRIRTQLEDNIKYEQLSTEEFQIKNHHRQATDRIVRPSYIRAETLNYFTSRSRLSFQTSDKRSTLYQQNKCLQKVKEQLEKVMGNVKDTKERMNQIKKENQQEMKQFQNLMKQNEEKYNEKLNQIQAFQKQINDLMSFEEPTQQYPQEYSEYLKQIQSLEQQKLIFINRLQNV